MAINPKKSATDLEYSFPSTFKKCEEFSNTKNLTINKEYQDFCRDILDSIKLFLKTIEVLQDSESMKSLDALKIVFARRENEKNWDEAKQSWLKVGVYKLLSSMGFNNDDQFLKRQIHPSNIKLEESVYEFLKNTNAKNPSLSALNLFSTLCDNVHSTYQNIINPSTEYQSKYTLVLAKQVKRNQQIPSEKERTNLMLDYLTKHIAHIQKGIHDYSKHNDNSTTSQIQADSPELSAAKNECPDLHEAEGKSTGTNFNYPPPPPEDAAAYGEESSAAKNEYPDFHEAEGKPTGTNFNYPPPPPEDAAAYGEESSAAKNEYPDFHEADNQSNESNSYLPDLNNLDNEEVLVSGETEKSLKEDG